MNGSLQVKGTIYYAVYSYKDSDGKNKSIWINTGIRTTEKKVAAKEKMQEIGELLDEGFTKEEILKIISAQKKRKEPFKNIREDNKSPEPEQEVKSDPAPKKEEKPSMIPIMTPMGQVVYTQELPEQKLTPLYQYIQLWLSDKKKNMEIEETTIDGYESICKNHLIPYFKKSELTVERATYRDIQEFFDYEHRKGNKATGKGLSSKSLHDILKILSMIFRSARRDKLVYDNPCEYVKLPKLDKKEPRILTGEQIDKLFSALKDEDIYPVVFITIIYGLRRSEVLGLQWSSIDFDNMTVSIRHTVVQNKKIVAKDRTKTDSSRRIYPMNEEIKNLLLKQKETAEENKRNFGADYFDSDYVFTWEDGQPLRPDYVTRKFKKTLEKNNLPDIRFHDLRHSCASFLVSNGFQLKDIQEWLGHADISTTANIYAHLYFGRKSQVLDAWFAEGQSVKKSDSEG